MSVCVPVLCNLEHRGFVRCVVLRVCLSVCLSVRLYVCPSEGNRGYARSVCLRACLCFASASRRFVCEVSARSCGPHIGSVPEQLQQGLQDGRVTEVDKQQGAGVCVCLPACCSNGCFLVV